MTSNCNENTCGNLATEDRSPVNPFVGRVHIETEYFLVTVEMLSGVNGASATGYSCLNKKTGVVEFESFSLVECNDFVRRTGELLDVFYGNSVAEELLIN